MDAQQEPEISNEPAQETVQKQKRVLNEAQLRNLALGRKMALEARKKKAIITKAAKLEVIDQREDEIEKAQETIERIQKKRIGRPPKPIAAVLNDMSPPPVVAPPPPPQPKEPDYKAEYYKMKINMLRERQQQQEQQQNWHTMYQQAPSSVHAADIARQSIMARANKAVLERAYREIFPDG